MDSATYRQIIGQLTNSCFISHNNFPCHNLLSQETLVKYSKDLNDFTDGALKNQFLNDFPCYETFDYNVQESIALFCGSGVIDFATDLVKKKLKWERQLKNIKIDNVKKAIKCIKMLQKNEKTKLPRNVKNYIRHFQKDPEPKFQGSYNWLYTGGTLFGLELRNETTLLSADCHGRKVGFNVFKLNESMDKIESKHFCRLTKPSPLLQISCKSKGNIAFVLLRQKDNLSLYKINNEDCLHAPEKLWRKKSHKSKLLTCVDLDYKCKEALVLDSNHVLHLYDIETKKRIYGFHGLKMKVFSLKKNSWNQAMFGDDHIFLGFKNSVCIIDSRDGDRKPKLIYTPSTVIDACESICSVLRSCCDMNYVYLATTHNLLQVDIRNGKTVQKWTHLMNNAPQFLSGIQNENQEFLVMHSANIEEPIGIKNEYITNEEEVNFLSRSMPCLLNNIKESLRLAKFAGFCLNPYVSKRFDFAVSGIHCFRNQKGNIHLFTGNSAGDIFLSKIVKKESDEIDKNVETVLDSFKLYESQLENIFLSTSFQNCEIINMKHILEEVKKPLDQKNRDQKPVIHWKNEKKFKPEDLILYKDVLAPKILKVWGFAANEPLKNDSMSSEAKVLSWMEKC